MRHHASGVARTLAGSPRLVLALLAAALVVAAAILTGVLRATPTVAEESAAAPSGTVPSLPSGKPDRFGKPRDPLSIPEIGYATALAAPALPASATTLSGAPGAELLAVDLASSDPTIETRPVAVDYYDYAADRTVVVTVELYSGKVVDVVAADELQPPPSPAETFEATRLLIGSKEGERVRTEYVSTIGEPIRASDLAITGGAYLDTASTKKDDACGVQRCIELQLQAPDGKYLSTSGFVVNLSTGDVLALRQASATTTLSGGKAN